MKTQIANYSLHLARGGGGGSSSGGGGGGGSSSGSSSYGGGSSSGDTGSPLSFFIFFSGIIAFVIVIKLLAKKQGAIVPSGFVDPLKDAKAPAEQKTAISRGREIFLVFQSSWSKFDLVNMQKLTSQAFYKKMVLELNVLKNYQRQNDMQSVKIQKFYLQQSSFSTSSFVAFVQASATDKLIDLRDNKLIFVDNSVFSEYWYFIRENGVFVLDRIEQTTASTAKKIPAIEQFASANGFYYDIDFGWLMMPSRGAIFGPSGFGNADINNHVIGYHKDKIVEFYSYEPKAGAGMTPLVVAQAILPRHYDDILVTQKSWYNFKPKQKGLTKIETESVDFNKKFAVWAADIDKATSFELLAPNFMERIYALSSEINIEVVDNVLYIYSLDQSIAYDQLLEILNWAFEEMKL